MTEMLSDAEVAERRQRLNEDAYFSVLKALLARGQTDVMRTIKLRKELNVSNIQHKQWVDELRAAVQAGPAAIEAARGPSAVAASTHMAAAGAGGRLSRQASTKSAGARQGGAQAPGQQQRGAAKKARTASAALQQQHMQQMQQQQPQQHVTVEQANMVGYNVQYYIETNRQWMKGTITDYDGTHIHITFSRGQPYEFTERVLWQQSEKLKMLNEKEPGVEFRPRV